MPGYLLTWNPRLWPWVSLPAMAEQVKNGNCVTDTWGCGRTMRIRPGDRLFLMRVAVPPKGIFGSGIASGAVYTNLHWRPERAARGDLLNFINFEYDMLLNPAAEPIFDLVLLQQMISDTINWLPQMSGTRISDSAYEKLEKHWTDLFWNR